MLKQLQEDIISGVYKGGDYQINFNFDEIYLNKDQLESTQGTS